MRNRFIGCVARALKFIGREEAGGEVVEYAIVLGLIVIVALGTIMSVGTKVVGRWTSLNSSLDGTTTSSTSSSSSSSSSSTQGNSGSSNKNKKNGKNSG